MNLKNSARQYAKDLVFKGYFHGVKRLGAATAGDIVVLVYHRVSDELRDNVTIGVAQFAEQIAFLSSNYALVGLRAIIEGEVANGSDPMVAITFDDGYLDNYENAFPILTEHGASATFFVSTDHITDQKPFAHDLDKLGYGLPNMAWAQIEEMHRGGMDFGSHTANHVDLGQADEATAWRELNRSDLTLKERLGIECNLFAFPFGRPQHMSEANHALVRKAGYSCCCSAYGGTNHRTTFDHFDIKRIGVNYGFSLPALRAYMVGWSGKRHANAA